MTLTDFLQHHGIFENPFRGEEARSDTVFARMARGEGPTLNGKLHLGVSSALFHSDFEKILGDLSRPASAVVFGEKGSGKTAIRLQIAQRVALHNAHPDAKGERVFLFTHDEFNGMLARLHERIGGKTPQESFQKTRLVDHIDAMLHAIVPRLVDAIIAGSGSMGGPAPGEKAAMEMDLSTLGAPGKEARRVLRRLDLSLRRDIVLLQAVYDRPDSADARTRLLRTRLGVGLPRGAMAVNAVWVGAPVLILAAGVYLYFFAPDFLKGDWAKNSLFGVAGLYILFLLKHFVWDRLVGLGLVRRVRRQLRVVSRGDISFARSFRQLHSSQRDPAVLPSTDSDEPRYAMLERLKRVLKALGYSSILIVIDRVDEPTLVSGDPERMRAVIWPLLNNKFLQQEGIGIKLLLPVELRHALFKESNAFFQEARLDKQSFVERLAWTGAMLYDLCDARLKACLAPEPGSAPSAKSLIDLFEQDVTRQDIIDALSQVHQPRDAFKLLYRCVAEHCSHVTRDQNQWRIPRHVLENVKKQEADRVQQLYRGIRPG